MLSHRGRGNIEVFSGEQSVGETVWNGGFSRNLPAKASIPMLKGLPTRSPRQAAGGLLDSDLVAEEV